MHKNVFDKIVTVQKLQWKYLKKKKKTNKSIIDKIVTIQKH